MRSPNKDREATCRRINCRCSRAAGVFVCQEVKRLEQEGSDEIEELAKLLISADGSEAFKNRYSAASTN